MLDRTTKLRWRRRLRRSQRHVEDMGNQAEVKLEKHFFKRLSRLAKVRRFIASWTLLFVVLICGVFFQARNLRQYYLESKPAQGGIYVEGILGTFTNANPLYAASSVDNSIERLVFAGLFKFDKNNRLVGELAKGYTLDERSTTYTVKLKDNLFWHDGRPLTADDVVFTYTMIQNPDAKSPLASSWSGITVKAIDKSTVTFTLPSILSAFPLSMVNGIVPKHLLDRIPPSQLRSISFNTKKPIGSGPFTFDAIEVIGINPEDREQRIALLPYKDYIGGKPKIDKLIIRTLQTEKQLMQAIESKEVNAAAGLSKFPEELKDDEKITDYNIPLTSQVMVFFKNSSELFKNVTIRRALASAIDTKAIIKSSETPVLASDGPLLKNQVGYNEQLVQKTNNKLESQRLLNEAGWVVGDKGIRVKDGKQLSFTLTTKSNSIYSSIAKELKKQWSEVGVDVEIIQLNDSDLQSAVAVHNYDSLLYGIAIGPDPDVFAFWHSSQADLRSPNRLNFSEYSSAIADKSLEGGRTRSEADIRAIKYKPFIESWINDAPAIALYQPKYLYVVREPLYNFSQKSMNNGADRYNTVTDWMIRETDQPK